MAVQVGELVGLVVDQHEDAVFGAQQGVETGLGAWVLLGNALGGSSASGVEKDVKGLDAAFREVGDIGSGDGGWAACGAGGPAQAPDPVMGGGGADRGKGEAPAAGSKATPPPPD